MKWICYPSLFNRFLKIIKASLCIYKFRENERELMQNLTEKVKKFVQTSASRKTHTRRFKT